MTFLTTFGIFIFEYLLHIVLAFDLQGNKSVFLILSIVNFLFCFVFQAFEIMMQLLDR